jgi:putative Holliday junction resolvase
MGVILGIDVGKVRVGLAVTDPAGLFPCPLGTFPRSKYRAEEVIKAEIETRGVELVLVGLPLMEDGSKSAQCSDIESFCRRLTKRIKIPIKMVDEHLTSEAAKDRIAQVKGSFRPERDRELLDAYAAVIIIEDYLNLNIKKRHE